MFSFKLQLLPKDQLNGSWTAKVTNKEFDNTKYFISFSLIDDNGCMEGLTKKVYSMREFTNETYVEIKNDSKSASKYREFLDLKNQCNCELSVQKLLPNMEIKQWSLLLPSHANKK